MLLRMPVWNAPRTRIGGSRAAERTMCEHALDEDLESRPQSERSPQFTIADDRKVFSPGVVPDRNPEHGVAAGSKLPSPQGAKTD